MAWQARGDEHDRAVRRRVRIAIPVLVLSPPFSTWCSLDEYESASSSRSQQRQAHVVQRPADLNAFEFTVLACLRAGQLVRRSVPRVEGAEKIAVTAQLEVAAGKIVRAVNATVVGP
jgi:hypothetical protein